MARGAVLGAVMQGMLRIRLSQYYNPCCTDDVNVVSEDA